MEDPGDLIRNHSIIVPYFTQQIDASLGMHTVDDPIIDILFRHLTFYGFTRAANSLSSESNILFSNQELLFFKNVIPIIKVSTGLLFCFVSQI